MDALSQRRSGALEEVAKVARQLVPILKDHNLTNTAGELGEKLFQLDAVTQEMRNIVLEDPAGTLEAVLKRMASQG